MCLFNMPRPERLLGGPRCGNLYVEKGEQCDCGLIQVTPLWKATVCHRQVWRPVVMTLLSDCSGLQGPVL